MNPMQATGPTHPGATAPLPADALEEQWLRDLSHRILRRGDLADWRRLFADPAPGAIRFTTEQRTFLASDSPFDANALTGEEAALLARHLGGRAEMAGRCDFLCSFDRPVAALQAAMLLQRLEGGRSVRIGLHAGTCTVASCDADGMPVRHAVGTGLAEAEAALAQAVPGTIVLSAQAYELLEGALPEQAPDALVATEMDDEVVRQASIILAPPISAALSTFAGLGMA